MGVDADGPPTTLVGNGDFTNRQRPVRCGPANRPRTSGTGLSKLESQSSATPVEPDLYADPPEAQIEQVQGHWQERHGRFSSDWFGVEIGPDLAKQAFYSLGKKLQTTRGSRTCPQGLPGKPSTLTRCGSRPEALAATLAAPGRSDEAIEEQSTLARLKDAPLGPG